MVDGVASLEQQAAVSRHPNNDYNQLFCSPKGSLSRTGLFFIPVRISVRLCVCTWGGGGFPCGKPSRASTVFLIFHSPGSVFVTFPSRRTFFLASRLKSKGRKFFLDGNRRKARQTFLSATKNETILMTDSDETKPPINICGLLVSIGNP